MSTRVRSLYPLENAMPSPPPGSTPPPVQSRLRILIVEDDALIGPLLSELLDDMGFLVCALATSELQAIEAAVRELPDLMLVDVALGFGSGLSAMRHIWGRGPMKCLFMTGDIAKLRIAAPDAVAIEKPFRSERLLQAIHLLIATGPPAAHGVSRPG